MKKLSFILSIMLLFAFATNFADAAIYRSAEDGLKDGAGPGKTGYNDVKTYFYNSVIICKDPGHEPCPKGVTSNEPQEQKDAMLYALDQIASGNLSGDESFGTSTNVKWTASDSDGTTSEIKVWDDSEEEPTGEEYH